MDGERSSIRGVGSLEGKTHDVHTADGHEELGLALDGGEILPGHVSGGALGADVDLHDEPQQQQIRLRSSSRSSRTLQWEGRSSWSDRT